MENFPSPVTFLNFLTLLPTLDMFYIVHLTLVMTSREPPWKCVRKPILSKVHSRRVICMSRQSCSAHTACRCMVVFYGTSLADSFLLWRLPLVIFSGESGGYQEIVTLESCIKLHVLTVFLIDLHAYLTVSQGRPLGGVF